MNEITLHTPASARMNAAQLDALRQAVQRDIDTGRMYGAAMIVARGGKPVLRETFGTVDGSRPARLDDLYLMMSAAKSFTAMLTLSAIEKGLFQLDTKIADLFPAFAAHGKAGITVFHLLTHQAGMFGLPVLPGLPPAELGNLDAVFARLAEMPADFPAGTQSSYSAFADYAVLGKLLQHTDPQGRTFARIARDELFAPLGMQHAQFGGTMDNPRRVPVSHTAVEKAKGAAQAGNLDMVENLLNSQAAEGCQIPAGNAFCTIDDLYRFAENLRLNKRGQGVRILSPALADYATQNHCGDMDNLIFREECEKLHLPPLKARYGLHGGYVRGTGHLLNVAGYTASPNAFSGMGGGSTFYMVDPERELTVAFVSAGFIEGLPHLIRAAKLNDLALAACD